MWKADISKWVEFHVLLTCLKLHSKCIQLTYCCEMHWNVIQHVAEVYFYPLKRLKHKWITRVLSNQHNTETHWTVKTTSECYEVNDYSAIFYEDFIRNIEWSFYHLLKSGFRYETRIYRVKVASRLDIRQYSTFDVIACLKKWRNVSFFSLGYLNSAL